MAKNDSHLAKIRPHLGASFNPVTATFFPVNFASALRQVGQFRRLIWRNGSPGGYFTDEGMPFFPFISH
jgi:hypothetical protein